MEVQLEQPLEVQLEQLLEVHLELLLEVLLEQVEGQVELLMYEKSQNTL